MARATILEVSVPIVADDRYGGVRRPSCGKPLGPDPGFYCGMELTLSGFIPVLSVCEDCDSKFHAGETVKPLRDA